MLDFAVMPFASGTLRHVLREAESIMEPSDKDAKRALAETSLMQLATEYADQVILPVLQEAINKLPVQAEPSELRSRFYMDLSPLSQHLSDQEIDAALGDSDRLRASGPAIAYRLATKIARKHAPDPGNRGKWLAKLGIVASHVAAISPNPGKTATELPDIDLAAILGTGSTMSAPPPPPPSVVEASADFDLDALLAMPAGPTPPAPPVPTPAAPATAEVPPVPLPDAPKPSPAAADDKADEVSDLSAAFQLINRMVEMDDKALAEKLGMGRSTFANYRTGRTKKVKVTAAQAKVLLAELDARLAMGRQAADILSAVQ